MSMSQYELNSLRKRIQIEMSTRTSITDMPIDIIYMIFQYLDSPSIINTIHALFADNYKVMGLSKRLLRENLFVGLRHRLTGLRYSLFDSFSVGHYEILDFPVFVFANWSPFGSKCITPIATITRFSTHVNTRELSRVCNRTSDLGSEEVMLTLYSGKYSYGTQFHHRHEVVLQKNIVINTRHFATHHFSLSWCNVYPSITYRTT